MKRALQMIGLIAVVGATACAEDDPCASTTCENAGTCVPRGSEAVCLCAAGFTGARCETDVDDCASSPCFNGGTCTDGVDRFTCTCAPGFTGVQCETDVDDCASSPCMNGGVCVDRVNGYTCACAAGFTGARCETDVDDCASSPCFNGGTCTDGVDRFTCTCAPGFTGAQCETNVDDCGGAPCLNGGVCIDRVDGHACACAAGFSGAQCETNIDDCAPGACFHGGTCMDGVNGFTCTCVPGAWGRQCEDLAAPLVITTAATLRFAVEGTAWSFALASTGGTEAVWSLETGAVNAAWLTLDATTGELHGTPTAADVGPAELTVRVADRYHPDNFAVQAFTFEVYARPSPAYIEGFEGACPAGWTLTGEWSCGVPTNVGPAAAHGGAQCIATAIAGLYHDNLTYAGNTATSPAITLPVVPMHASFWAWIDTEGSTYDGFNLSVSSDGGASFVRLDAVSPAYGLMVGGEPAWGGHQAPLGWQLFSADLAAYAGQTVQLRFAFRSDSSGTYPGVYLDDLRVE